MKTTTDEFECVCVRNGVRKTTVAAFCCVKKGSKLVSGSVGKTDDADAIGKCGANGQDTVRDGRGKGYHEPIIESSCIPSSPWLRVFTFIM